MSLAIASGGERALIIGDVATNPAQVSEPDWEFAFDMDPKQAVRTREQIIERAEAEGGYLIACHYHSFGRVVRTEGRRYWRGI